MLYTCTYILYTDIHVVDVQLLYTHGHTQLHIYTCSDIHEYAQYAHLYVHATHAHTQYNIYVHMHTNTTLMSIHLLAYI